MWDRFYRMVSGKDRTRGMRIEVDFDEKLMEVRMAVHGWGEGVMGVDYRSRGQTIE